MECPSRRTVIAKIAYLFAASKGLLHRPTGHSIHIRELCRALEETGQEVYILAASNGNGSSADGAPVREVAPGIASYLNRRSSRSTRHRPRFPDPEARRSGHTSMAPRQVARDLARVAWWKGWDTYFHWRVRQELSHERPDFLYERYVRGTSTGMRLARELHVPFIVEMNTSFTFPSEWWEHHSPITPWVVARTERRIARSADRVIVVSTHLRDYLLATGVPEEKLVLMFNGADSRRFRPMIEEAAGIRAEYGLRDKQVIGFVGSLKPWHGVDGLIRSFRQCVRDRSNLRLVIVGDGPLRDSLELLVRESGLSESVVFTGSVPHEDVPAYVSSLDIAVCPAPREPSYHLSPIKLFEYMAAARPVIAAKFSDVPAVVRDHENGILVEPGNDAELARAMLELADDPDLRGRLGQEARRDVERSYSWQRNAERVLELYRDVAQTRGAVRPAAASRRQAA